MVKQVLWDHERAFECEECQLIFEDQTVAVSCEEWDKTRHACSLEITRKALNKGGVD